MSAWARREHVSHSKSSDNAPLLHLPRLVSIPDELNRTRILCAYYPPVRR